MNQMTVRVISTVQHRYQVSGEGYSFEGIIKRTEGDADENLDHVLFPVLYALTRISGTGRS